MDAIHPQKSFSVPITNGAEPAYAGFWLRFCAVVIDGIVLYIPAVIIIGITIGVFAISDKRADTFIDALYFLISLIYSSLMESSSWQATVGKRLIGIKVTDINGNRISFERATGRTFAKMLSGLILGIGYIMIAFTKRKQGLHDMLAGTLVVKDKSSVHEQKIY